MRPHLVRWHKKYAKRGLVVIEINRGVVEPRLVMKKMVAKHKPKHAVLWDRDCRNNKNYGLENWPTSYLVGVDGKVFWEGNAARFVNRPKATAAMEKLFEKQFAKREKVVAGP